MRLDFVPRCFDALFAFIQFFHDLFAILATRDMDISRTRAVRLVRFLVDEELVEDC